ncbi:MAG: sigma-70 family RNA polymerase sigma factor [Planctomycetota bacterium]
MTHETMKQPPTEVDRSEAEDAHRAGVWRHLRMLGADPELADDLTQEAFLVWLRKRPGDVTSERLPAWLRGVARNLLRNARRQGRLVVEVPTDELAESVWLQVAGRSDGDDRLAALRECLTMLAEPDRDLLDRRYRDGDSLEALGASRGIDAEALRSRLRRIQQRLFECVQRRTRTHD